MANLKELYEQNVNIMEYLREKNKVDCNTTKAILASYDQQAGSYIANLESDEIKTNYHVNFQKSAMVHKDFIYKFCSEIVERIKDLKFNTVLDAGTGESTSMNVLSDLLKNPDLKFYGFDVSASRIKTAKEYAKKKNFNPILFTADMNNIPLKDNSFDLVYTIQAIEPNTNNELNIVRELFRVCRKYLVMIEPSYELGNQETKVHIEQHKYIKNLKQAVDTLDGKLLKYELLPIGSYENQQAIYIIEKNNPKEILSNKPDFACPVCKNYLEHKKGELFCENCGLVYPIIDGIEILNTDSGIIFSKF